MNSRRFDSLARTLATQQGASGAQGRQTRRGFLGALVAVGAGLLGARGTGAQVSQAQCGNKTCANNPGKCTDGCVCCVYANGNSRCRPPGTCAPGTVACPPGQVLGPTGVCGAPTTTTTTTTTTVAPTCAPGGGCVPFGEGCEQNADCAAGWVCRPPDTRPEAGQTCASTGTAGGCCLNTAVAGGPCTEVADCRGAGDDDPCSAVTCEGGVCVVRGVPCCTDQEDGEACYNLSQYRVCCRGICCAVGTSCDVDGVCR